MTTFEKGPRLIVDVVETRIDAGAVRYEANHRATRYRLTRFRAAGDTFLLIDVDGGGRGTWLRVPRTTTGIAWSYLADKLALNEGDREGYVALIEAALGIEVF